MKNLAKRIIEAMGDMTQQELAKRSGVRQSTINRTINEGTVPRLDTMIAIAKALKKPLSFFIDDNEQVKGESHVDSILHELHGTDLKMAMVCEDIIDMLLKKGIAVETDLSTYTQEIISRRRILRKRLRLLKTSLPA